MHKEKKHTNIKMSGKQYTSKSCFDFKSTSMKSILRLSWVFQQEVIDFDSIVKQWPKGQNKTQLF